MDNKFVKLVDTTYDFLSSLNDDRLKPFLTDWPSTNTPVRSVAPNRLPVLTYMDQAVKTASAKTEGIVYLLASMADRIAWGQTYSEDDIGAAFLERYGWTAFIGLRGPIPSERMACGILMLGPRIEYPRHRHEAEEVYIPLTGQTLWCQGDQDWSFQELGLPIHHAPWVPHAMKTGASPLLALYLWRAGDLTQKSLIDSQPG